MKPSLARMLLLTSVVLSACGKEKASDTDPVVPQGLTEGEVIQMITLSTAPDGDGDYLPDDVEATLGTNPGDRDSDHDGMPDVMEVFGKGGESTALVANLDGDDAIAAADADDDGDGVNDGMQVDSDGDGIANFLEYY